MAVGLLDQLIRPLQERRPSGERDRQRLMATIDRVADEGD
jgi:hypothetical protein